MSIHDSIEQLASENRQLRAERDHALALVGGVQADNRNLRREVEGLRLELTTLRAAATLAREALGMVETEGYDHGEERACAWCGEDYTYRYDKDYKVVEEGQLHGKDCARQLALAALDAALGEKP